MKRFKKHFGGKVTPKELIKYKASSQFDGTKFVNSTFTKININLKTFPKLLVDNFRDTKKRAPLKPLPIIPFDPLSWEGESDIAKMAWYGHSAALLKINNCTVFIDPMMGPDTSPIAPKTTKRFSEGSLEVIDTLPDIDLVLFTHDHYDHLDLPSIERLAPKVKQWFVALGVAKHLVAWGIPKEKIKEFDWWGQATFAGVEFYFTPARHFSGRALKDRNKCLWGGWVIKSVHQSIYWSGDSGYGTHFKDIGDRLGPFDWGFVECGQYNENWHAIHMYPEESVQAGIEARAKRLTPIHWSGFTLALHSWKEPVERFESHAKKLGIDTFVPSLGQIFELSSTSNTDKWWENHD